MPKQDNSKLVNQFMNAYEKDKQGFHKRALTGELSKKEREIKLLKNNGNRDLSDLEWVSEFYEFMQGNVPEPIKLGRGSNPKLSKKKAMSIIWYLQEWFSILPDHIEICSVCGDLLDSYSSGKHSELTEKFYCDGCIPITLDEQERIYFAQMALRKSD